MQQLVSSVPRILIVDDNRAIHADFQKILGSNEDQFSDLAREEEDLFGGAAQTQPSISFEIESAFQGDQAIAMIEQALREGRPYALAFMDVRMPPGLDGIETTAAIWKIDPDLQVVLCTAYSDYSWQEVSAKIGQTDRLVILKKPFDNIEVLQLAHTMTEKWRLLQQARLKLADLEAMVTARTAELAAANQKLGIEVAERTQAQTALEQSQQIILRQERLAAVGQLSAGIAHDFNNIMTVIQGHAGLLMLDPATPRPSHESLREIEGAANRAANLTRQLLAFSRKQVLQSQAINLGKVAFGLKGMLARTLGEHIQLTCGCAPGLPAVFADSTMIEQILMNLAVNARDAMPDGGSLAVSIGAVEFAEQSCARDSEARPGSFVCLKVSDTGCGMDKATLSKIFEPFFTTKDIGKGTGLGLATVYGIVKQHQGWIDVHSEPRKGTTFSVYFPVSAEATLGGPHPNSAAAAVAGGKETVLLVEDEPALRRLVRRTIEHGGYSVIEAGSGREALETWEKENCRIDLLLTDLVMPGGISGTKLAEALLALNPNLKVIYTSGYVGESGDTEALLNRANFLAKPYNPATLMRMVRCCLDNAPVPAAAA